MQETRQQKKNQIPCYCMKIRRASAVITKFYDAILGECGITARQYSLLFKVKAAEGCSVRELADAAELERSTLARNLKPLYQRGLIVDVKQPGTRKSRLKLTPAGEERLEFANLLWEKAQNDVLQKLGEDGISGLDKLLGLLETL